MQAHPLVMTTVKTVLGLLAVAAGALSLAAPPMPPRTFRIIDAVCDLTESEVSPEGLFVCRYVCRDPDQTKATVVYKTAGSGQCRTPLNTKIKQYINKDKP